MASGLPVWVGVSCKKDAVGNIILLEGEPLTEMIDVIKEYNIPLVSIMHTEVEYVDDCLDVLMNNWEGAVGIYARSGRWGSHKMIYDSMISPADYANESKRWMDRGVQVYWWGCGIDPDHIHSLSEIINT